jgi:hypothetical protein
VPGLAMAVKSWTVGLLNAKSGFSSWTAECQSPPAQSEGLPTRPDRCLRPWHACMVAALSASPLLTLGQRAVSAHGGAPTVRADRPEAHWVDFLLRPSNQAFRGEELSALPAD